MEEEKSVSSKNVQKREYFEEAAADTENIKFNEECERNFEIHPEVVYEAPMPGKWESAEKTDVHPLGLRNSLIELFHK